VFSGHPRRFSSGQLEKEAGSSQFRRSRSELFACQATHGGVNSVNVLQFILNGCFKTLGRGLHPWFLTYVDDIILTSKSVDEMVERLRDFLELCKLHNIVLKKSKSSLLRKDTLLGFIVSKGKLRPADNKMDQIELVGD
jgi:hypothetical protein